MEKNKDQTLGDAVIDFMDAVKKLKDNSDKQKDEIGITEKFLILLAGR